ncbi:MAG: hypothetical protein WCR49_10745, partial [Opitutae bacterium]
MTVSLDPIRTATPWGSRRRAVVVMVTMMAVLGFYYWTVKSTGYSLTVHGQQADYYNLLVDGFQSGHLYMKVTPHPDLLALPPEQRPGTAPFLLDASLYEGHYYLYFGVVPVLALYWPCAAITGHDLPEGWAALIFAAAAFGFSVWWWLDVRKKFFPRLGLRWDVMCILALGLCTAVPSTLRRPMLYEVAILAGWAFGMIGLWALTRAGLASRQQKKWLLGAGVAMGLAIGSRPNLAPAALLTLLVGSIVVALEHRDAAIRFGRRVLVLLVWAGCGAGIIGLGLGAYNWARFGRVVEFGHTYQIGIKPVHLFHAANFWHNARLYYFAAPQLGGYFPFVSPAEEPAKPADYVGREQAHGEWIWGLLTLLAVFMFARAWWKRSPGSRRSLTLVAPVGAWFAVNLLVTCLTGVRANRYMVDFHPALVLGSLLIFGVGLSAPGRVVRWVRGAAVIGMMVAVCFNILASMQVHDWFSKTAPGDFRKLAHIADGTLWRLAPWILDGVGDREIEVHWPASDVPGPSVLISAGPGGFDDGIWVETDGGSNARFIYQHWDYGETASPWFPIDRSRSSLVRFSGAFLLPPPTHAWYGDRTESERLAMKRRLRISVDGQLRFDRDVPSHNAAPWTLHWGFWQVGGQGKVHRYTAPLGPARHLPVAAEWLAELKERRGRVLLRLKLPAGHMGLVEPLVQVGIHPNCDVLMVHLTRPGFIQLLHDSFGVGGFTSEEFAVNYDDWQTIEVEMPAAHDGLSWSKPAAEVIRPNHPLGLRVTWNGREVLASPLPVHPTSSQDIVVGANLVGASACRPLFPTEIKIAPFLAALPLVSSGILEYTFKADDTLLGTSGVLLSWELEGRRTMTGLIWRRATPAEPVFLGWFDKGRITWADRPLDGGSALLSVYLPPRPGPKKGVSSTETPQRLLQVEQNGRRIFSTPTYFPLNEATTCWAMDGRSWQAKDQPTEVSVHVPTGELPGRIVF